VTYSQMFHKGTQWSVPSRHGIHRVLVSPLILTWLLLVLPLGAQNWTQLTPTGTPPAARAWASAIFDPATSKMIVFSGTFEGNDFNDVWSLSTSGSPQWTQVFPTGTLPAARLGQSAVYDSANSRIIMFGGGLGALDTCANDVWVLSNANSVNGTPAWTQLSTSGGPPVPRIYHTAVYDPTSNRMIVFGGNNCSTVGGQYYNDVWVLSNANGLGGTPVWTQLTPSGGPSVRQGSTAVYDPTSNRMIVFGGWDETPVSDVWVLSNANGSGGAPAWTQLSPGGGPIPPREFHTAIYDPTSNRMTVFGGLDVGLVLSDTWTLTFANGSGGTPSWVELVPLTSITAREAPTAVYNASSDSMIVFGGILSPNSYDNETWVLTDANGINTPPIPISVTPSSGSSLEQTFQLQYADPVGATDLTAVWVWFTSNFGTVSNTCLANYVRATNQLFLYNDAGTSGSFATPGVAGTLSNSQCSINAGAATVTTSGTNLTLDFPVTFTAAYAGAKTTYMYAAGSTAASGWQTMGTWNVPATSSPTIVSLMPNSGSGLQETFALQYADPLGATDLTAVWVWITSNFNSTSVANSCIVYYARASNQLFLYNDAGTGGSFATTGTVSNSQCSINAGTASVLVSGTNLTLNLPVTFTAAYAGAKNIYMYAAGSSAGSGWQNMGSWTVPATGAPPTTVSMTPSSGSGLQQTFALQYADQVGATDLTAVWVWFTSNFGTVSNTCLVYYARAGNYLFLYNDAGTGGSSATLGVAATLSNSQCSINAGAATVTTSGTNLTLDLPVTFTAAYAGAKTTYMYAAGSSAASGWQPMGSWTVPGTSGPPTTVSVTPNSGSGLQQTFALQYADPLGATDLTAVWVWITGNFNSVSVASTCLVNYARAANQLFLYNDAGTGGSSATPGVAGTLSNSQCSINAGAATVTTSGTNLTLNLPVTFAAAYAGAKTTYMYAAGSSAASGWQTMGSWTP